MLYEFNKKKILEKNIQEGSIAYFEKSFKVFLYFVNLL